MKNINEICVAPPQSATIQHIYHRATTDNFIKDLTKINELMWSRSIRNISRLLGRRCRRVSVRNVLCVCLDVCMIRFHACNYTFLSLSGTCIYMRLTSLFHEVYTLLFFITFAF